MPTIEDTRYLAIDPGETIGWANFLENGTIFEMGQFRYENINRELDLLLHSKLKHVITEDFIRFKHVRQKGGGRNSTSEVIGKIELLADLRSVAHSRQLSSVYKVGAAWGGFEIPSNHSISHQWVAAAHGIYWLQQHGIRKPGQAIPKDER